MTPDHFKAIRRRMGLSQTALAHLLGLASGKQAIWRVENGQTAISGPIARLMRIADAGRVDLIARASEAEWAQAEEKT